MEPDAADAQDEATDVRESGQDTAAPLHDQWLLDEALAETFPASDPISPSVRSPVRAR